MLLLRPDSKQGKCFDLIIFQGNLIYKDIVTAKKLTTIQNKQLLSETKIH